MRTLILICVCAAFVGIAILDAKAADKARPAILRDAAVALVLGLFACWVLVHWVGIFDGWKYSLRR